MDSMRTQDWLNGRAGATSGRRSWPQPPPPPIRRIGGRRSGWRRVVTPGRRAGVRLITLAALILGLVWLYGGSAPTGLEPVGAQTPHPPRYPTDLSVSLVDDVVTLSWSAPSEDADSVTHYQVLRRSPGIDAIGHFAVIALRTGTSATTWQDRTANVAGRAYTYRVKAWRGEALSRWSRYSRIDLPATYVAPAPPVATEAGLAPSALSVEFDDGRMALSWQPPAAEAGLVTEYEIVRTIIRAGEVDPQTSTFKTGTSNPAWTDDVSDVPAGSQLSYAVSALRGDTASVRSNAVDLRNGDAEPVPLQPVKLTSRTITPIEPVEDRDPEVLSQQDSGVTLVSNADRSADKHFELRECCSAIGQEFTTGSHPAGYDLTSIGIRFKSIDNPTAALPKLNVTLHGELVDYYTGGELLCTLDKPSNLSTGMRTFGASHCPTLDPETTYYVAISMPSDDTHSIQVARSTDLSESTALEGWSIANLGLIRIGYFWATHAPIQSYIIEVVGQEVPVPAVPTVTNEAWSSTLTPAQINSSLGYWAATTQGTLSDTTFTGNTHTFTVLRILRHGDELWMEVAASGTTSVNNTGGKSDFASVTAAVRDREAQGGFAEFDTLQVVRADGQTVNLQFSDASIQHRPSWSHPSDYDWSSYPRGRWDYEGSVMITWTGLSQSEQALTWTAGSAVTLKFTKESATP